MPPRLNCSSAQCASRALRSQSSKPIIRPTVAAAAALPQIQKPSSSSRSYASAAAPLSMGPLRLPADYIPPSKPPTARRSEDRKSQLLRSYTALLRSTPLILFFQHNNLTAVEWAAVRRELRKALSEVPASSAFPESVDPTKVIELSVLRTRIFDVAFKIVQFYDAEAAAKQSNKYTHDLSKAAYEAIKSADVQDANTAYAQIAPLLSGPVAAVTFPILSPVHLAAVLRILAPSPPAFPAPTRKKSPGYHDPIAQSGFQKLILVGGRVERKTFDSDGVKWIGGIEGGLDGLRAQLVHMLQSAGLGLTTTLEGASKSLWLTLESRRSVLDEEQNPKKETSEEAKAEGS